MTEQLTPESWERIKLNLEQASKLSGAELEQYLAQLDTTLPGVAGMVRRFLAASAGNTTLLESPPWKSVKSPESGQSFIPGQILNERFQVEEFIGCGGTGEVYRAFDRHRQIHVALKTVRLALIDNALAI